MEEQKQLLLSLEQLNEERMNRILSTLFASLQGYPVYSMTVQIIVSEMLHMVEMLWKRHFPHASKEDNKLFPSRNDLGRMGSLAELEQWLLHYCACLMEELKKQHAGGPYSRHISKATQFIADHYASNISLELVAGELNLNPSYLSRLFKEETQMTFTEYLNHVRIKSSCLLMESGSYALKEVSSQVGFFNYTYFFKVFKLITGITPQAYMDSRKQSNK
ncbi:AraC family transcriptional regulator [Paenibacillus sp. CC-CFT747]|nr:AraC family transcriptional regulator [Paenibacillus sp. CC-CFT747]